MLHKMPDPIYKVLIVDDDLSIQRLISSILTLKGHQCEGANDGMEALEKFSKTPFDAVITDIRMPRMDGIELTRELLKLQPALPIIVMTGYHDISIDEKAILTRASDFINKPFSLMDSSYPVQEGDAHPPRALTDRSGSGSDKREKKVDSSMLTRLWVPFSVLLPSLPLKHQAILWPH